MPFYYKKYLTWLQILSGINVFHHFRLKESDRKYTDFEANGQLFEFTCLPFRVTKSVPAFQRAMNEIVREENLTDIFTYLDNVINGGETEKHDNNVENFMRVVKKRCLILNDSKTIRKVTMINALGYCVGNGRPIPFILRSLQASERGYSIVEKKALAIIEAVRK